MYSSICKHNLKPNSETFRSMINMCVKMKDVSSEVVSVHISLIQLSPGCWIITIYIGSHSIAVRGCIQHAKRHGENEVNPSSCYVQCYNCRIFQRGYSFYNNLNTRVQFVVCCLQCRLFSF